MTVTHTADLTYTDWILIEPQFDPIHLQYRETVFTLGNGYLSTRGSFEEGITGDGPGTLMHGVYDQVPVVYAELANCPDWLPLRVIVNGEDFSLDHGEVLSYERKLDLRRGLLSRSVRWRSPKGQTLDLEFERFTSLAEQHVMALQCRVTPVDFQGEIELQASINGYPVNQGFNHWECLGQGEMESGMWLRARTRNSRIELGMAVKMTVSVAETAIRFSSIPGYPTLSTTVPASLGQTVTFEKLATVYTSRDQDNPVQAAQAKLVDLATYGALQEAHEQDWDEVWDKGDIVIEGDVKAQLAVRFNLFQLYNCAPWQDEHVSIGAKTLSGFGYCGHVFWDTEIFILPLFIFTQPSVARNLLSYRYHNLLGARRKAEHYGYKGAMFPWESAGSGDEVTPRWVIPNDPYGSDVRVWCRDHEIHISADIAYAIWHYWKATGDHTWMRDCGAEIVFDTAIFWSSRVELNTKHDRYEIREVVGADEYHDHQVHNNAFTNRLAQWHLEKALLVYDWLVQTFPYKAKQLEQELDLTPERRARWQDIAQNLWILYDPNTGLIEQHEGFFQLQDLDLADFEPRTQSMHAILGMGVDGTNQYQVLKQPDVLMLLYLMREAQEFPYSIPNLQQNWDYYAPRTDITYGSSLGPAIHAILASDLGQSVEAYDRFMQAALVDIEDVRGNADAGIHGASCGGVWQAVVFGFGGIQFTEQGPVATAHLPPGWQRLKFKLHWHGEWHQFDLQPESGQQQGTIVAKEPSMDVSQTLPATQSALDLQGVIFDLDGVLTDTAEYHYQAWQQLADEEGLPFDRQANEGLRGLSRRESLLQIVGDRQIPETKLEEMMDRKNRYYVDLIQNVTSEQLLPGALTLLDELRRQGIKVAIGSGSKNARAIIDKLGIGDRIDAMADGYSVSRSKPEPDVFLYAADQLGLKPSNCAVVEDARAGVEAALAAGMWAVGLGPPERVGIAHLVLPNLAGVHVADLQQGLRSS